MKFPIHVTLFALFLGLTVWLSRRWKQRFWLQFRLWQLVLIGALTPALIFQSFQPVSIIEEKVQDEGRHVSLVFKVSTPHLFLKDRSRLINDYFVRPKDNTLYEKTLTELREKAKKETFEMAYWRSDDYTSGIGLILNFCVLGCLYLPKLFQRSASP